ncbi:MAG: oligopeptide ABC transporter ATP-binding protein OppF [Bdellovibrionales bacterium RIFOXYD12_FULL_39_22]|nr:MAG: oligopeptide ABC transporter ATP-binding protein OppF [Bdellovibrionales bacterium RIFOXYB1_FULL_39_21]OFZ42650.1 MAG: oligopeptide ABC transporter ATP-binding protein OppF [Bdellovibrionales bacterium RIFOXYC12_FULL_39_17]OFZ47082.1 MAG: oligopeptide ABC transporter ATP-binding protein OppF [Bdellovibrionales bacterium RIFOXYC1_FULL_39_130]OFZ75330.1 MAG: oligopeptide ABC transporter ATP-binding protein OppF [Bdellovibrionales bacterium RIFOXYD1_FULL_39_84]OFZ93281.1 MAG: oligopeptide 
MAYLLEVTNLTKHYQVANFFQKPKVVRALDGISFTLNVGDTLAIVGESGCGKSTLAKTILGIEQKTAGEIFSEGKKVEEISRSEFIKSVQMIFQDPYSSLNPRQKAWEIIAEPLYANLQLSRADLRSRVLELMKSVGLREDFAERYPHMFSGGQRQRIGIARALTLHPKILICDEPISALDVSIQAQVLNLLMELQARLQLSYLFIGHNLNVVRHIATHVLVMYLGKVAEYGPVKAIFENPQHPYTQALLQSTPSIKSRKKFEAIEGELPSPFFPPSGCAFHLRCKKATAHCRQTAPQLLVDRDGRQVACLNL